MVCTRFKDTITKEYVESHVKKKGLNITIKNVEKSTSNSGKTIKIISFVCYCGSEATKNWDSFRNTTHCQKCGFLKGRPKQKYSEKDIVAELDRQELAWINKDTMKNRTENIELQCKKCGYIKKQQLSHLFTNTRKCKKCIGMLKKTTEVFAEEVSTLTNKEYELISEYKNQKTDVIIRHLKCNNEYLVLPNNFTGGKRCPFCKMSKGEEAIKLWLEKRNVNYQQQYKSKDCVNKKELPFDFAILNTNGEVLSLIEYDGIQHFQAVERFGGDSAFEATILRDSIKNKYCIDKGIPLLRIPYWEFNNIEDILSSWIKGE